MIFLLAFSCIIFGFHESCAVGNQTRQRASTAEFAFYVATKENLQRNRVASMVEQPHHKKTFTQAYNVLTPPPSPYEEQNLFPEYLQNVGHIRTPRGSIMTQKKVVKKPKAACVSCVVQ